MREPAKLSITCPKCGGHQFKLLEDLTGYHLVEGINDDGVLEVSGELNDHSDEGENQRLQCVSHVACEGSKIGATQMCLHESEIPDGIKLEWI